MTIMKTNDVCFVDIPRLKTVTSKEECSRGEMMRLRRCPFCHKPAKIEHSKTLPTTMPDCEYTIQCGCPYKQLYGKNPVDLRESWNRRVKWTKNTLPVKTPFKKEE